jgi:hypothetical protein
MSYQPVSTKKPDNNKNYDVDFLFEYEGCKVYRFYDYGNYVYFTNCRNETTSFSNDSVSVKTVNIPEDNPLKNFPD